VKKREETEGKEREKRKINREMTRKREGER